MQKLKLNGFDIYFSELSDPRISRTKLYPLIEIFALIFGSALAGLFMKVLEVNFGMDDWRYRFYPLWVVAFQIPALIMAWLMLKEWRKLGGVNDYTPPQATLA